MVTSQEKPWFYVDRQGQKQGPFPPTEFKALADQGVIRADSKVWSEGYQNWLPASEVHGLIATNAPTPASAPTPPPVPPAVPAQPSRPASPASASATATEHLKPRKGPFLIPRTVPFILLFAAFSIGMGFLLTLLDVTPWIGLVIFLPAAGLVCLTAFAAYRKERYELHPTRLLRHSGGLMSDQTTELEIRNVTHVKVQLPWLRYKLFRIGNVLVESAGNSKPMVLRCIHDPNRIYDEIRDRMRHNGYDLTQSQLMHEEKPALIGVITECLGMLILSVTLLLGVGLPGLAGIAEGMQAMGATWALYALGALAVGVAFTFLVVHFLDLRCRTYRVYNDVVVYEEGFLTRENAFIPYENIADAATKRSFIDQILNLFDVLVSCQGSSSEIKFRRLSGGVALSYAIDQLVVQARQKPAPAPASQTDRTEASTARAFPRRDEPALTPVGEAWVADLQMNAGRTLVPLLLLLPLVPLWIIAMLQAGVRLFSTRYAVRPGSIRHSYRFLTTHDREFACDKITGLVIKENPWDRLFGTVTLRFWSIGSGQALDLTHVSRRNIDFEALIQQIGVPPASERPLSLDASFSLLTWLRARLAGIAVLAVLAACFALGAWQFGELYYWLLVALPIGCVPVVGHAWLYYFRQRLRFHDHHIEAEQGVLVRQRYYVRYRNAKKIQVTRYPGGSEGSLQLFVAGEQQMANQTGSTKKSGKQSGITRQCSFTSGLLPNIMENGQLADDILCGRVDPSPEASAKEPLELIAEAPRAIGNSLLKLVLVSVLLVPLVALLPLTIPILIISVKRWRYRLELGRVTMSWGLLYHKQVSILLDRVDSLSQHQGPLNKMFGNGNVSIMTAGSSKPDLVMLNTPDFKNLYDEIRKVSQGD